MVMRTRYRVKAADTDKDLTVVQTDKFSKITN